jgi:hypothetical protein
LTLYPAASESAVSGTRYAHAMARLEALRRAEARPISTADYSPVLSGGTGGRETRESPLLERESQAVPNRRRGSTR